MEVKFLAPLLSQHQSQTCLRLVTPECFGPIREGEPCRAVFWEVGFDDLWYDLDKDSTCSQSGNPSVSVAKHDHGWSTYSSWTEPSWMSGACSSDCCCHGACSLVAGAPPAPPGFDPKLDITPPCAPSTVTICAKPSGAAGLWSRLRLLNWSDAPIVRQLVLCLLRVPLQCGSPKRTCLPMAGNVTVCGRPSTRTITASMMR